MGLIWGSPLDTTDKKSTKGEKKRVSWGGASLRQFSDGGTIYGPDKDTELKPPHRKLTEQERKLSKQNFDIIYVFLYLLNSWSQSRGQSRMISRWIYKFNKARYEKQLSLHRLPEDIHDATTGDLIQKCKLLIEQLENKEGKITVVGDSSTGKMIVYYEETSQLDEDGEAVKQVSILDVKSLQKYLEIQNNLIF